MEGVYKIPSSLMAVKGRGQYALVRGVCFVFVVASIPAVLLKACQALLGPLISAVKKTHFTFHQSSAEAGQRKVPDVSILFILHIHI